MTMSIGRRSFACLVLPALAAACSSTDPVLYTLQVKPGPQFPKSPPVVQVRDIGLARYLDRREIVRSSADYKLGLASNDWWGEQLGGMLSRVIVLGLSQRLPSSNVYAEGGAISADPNAVLAVNIQRLEPDASGANVELLAQAAVEFNRPRRTANRSFQIVRLMTARTVAGQVAATSDAVGELTDGLAALLAQ
ncbi:MAG: membrane integrity-associated transporter subunit PqiC [Rhodospirillaceae bacterium]